MFSSRSRMTVMTLAMSLRTSRTRIGLSSCPMASWKRRLNSSSFSSASLRFSSSAVRSRNCSAFTAHTTRHCEALDDLALDGQLLRREAQRFASHLGAHPGHLEHDPPRLDHGHPHLGRPLAAAHTGFRGLLGYGLVGEDANPHLAAAAHMP